MPNQPDAPTGTIDLAELQRLTKLPDDTLFRLLRDGAVRCCTDSSGKLLVDPNSISAETLASSLVAPATSLLQQHDAVIRERLREVLRNEFGSIVHDAIQILQNYRPDRSPKEK